MNTPIQLTEAISGATVLSGSKWRAKIIAGNVWGSSAYYPNEVLERDGSRVFTSGLHMYQNHMTEAEKWDRPEGSVENLVGHLASDAEFDPNGEEGPGLYADVEFYPSYVQRISEIHKDVGLSVRASGLTEDGEMDGRYGPILVAFLSADSVDVVTRAGAGGKLTSILESNRELAGRPIEDDKEGTQSVTDVTKEDFAGLKTDLIEAITALGTSLKESLAGIVPAEIQTVTDPEVLDESNTPVEIDHAAVAEALRSNNLPAPAAKAIVEALKSGSTLEEAVQGQVELREAFVATAAETGVVTVKESNGELTGRARAVKILG
jgi:hypothetical protein